MHRLVDCLPPADSTIRRGGAPRVRRPRLASLLLIMALAALALLTGCSPEGDAVVQNERYLVGAYYYTWYPENFDQGYLRHHLKPRQEPVLGRYSSRDPQVAARQIAWCSRYGVDFLAVGWWPRRPQQNTALDQGLLAAPNLGDIKFCMFYETWNLGFDGKLGITLMTKEKEDYFIRDVLALAAKYFDNPSYLRVAGRPVIIFYLTRSIYVNYRPVFTRLRKELKEAGWNAYFIGDDIFWKVIEAKGDWDPKTSPPQPTDSTQPQVDRIKMFDAITAYNLYEGGKPHHGGYAAQSAHIPEVEAKYRLYRDNLPEGVALVPSVMPGYNDRGVRLGTDHYVIPRQWDAASPPGSFFVQSLQRIGMAFADPRLNMVMVTSFNEWNEDTSIEPVNNAPATTADDSKSGHAYTMNYPYYGYGETYLAALRDTMCAVAGRVTRPDGSPAAGVEVAAWNQGRVAARDTTDQAGYYTLSRLGMPAGTYDVGPVQSEARAKVVLGPHRAARPVDLALPPAN